MSKEKERELRRSFTPEDSLFADIKEGNDISETIKAGLDPNLIDRNGNFPLIIAVNNGHIEICKTLLILGSNPDLQDRSGNTALHRASQGEKIAIMNMLLHEFDADHEIGDNAGRTALHLASKSGHREAVKILIAAGAVINSTTPDGYTPLHWCCWDGHLNVAKLLYEAGADIEHPTKFGNTPLHKAIEKKRVDVIKWLLFKGANVSAVNKSSMYPLDILKYNDRLNVLNEDNYPLHALIAHRSSLWLQIVLFCSKSGDHTRMSSYLARYPQLTSIKDSTGRLAIDILDPLVRQGLLAMLHWHGRFRLLENLAIYSTTETLVVKAVDEESLNEFGSPKRVALKLMLSKDRYRREIDARASNLSAEYVLQVVANYPKYEPEMMQSRISNADVMHSRTNSIKVVTSRRRIGSVNQRKRSFVGDMSAVHRLSRVTSSCEPGSSSQLSEKWVEIDHAITDSPALNAAPDVVPLDLAKAASRGLTKDEGERLFCIVMPLADRDLYVAMKHDVQFAGGVETLQHTKDTFTQLSRCVGHLHDAGLIHADIKPMNVVLSEGRWKLTDLDNAVLIGEVPSNQNTNSTAYMPPECFEMDIAGGEIKSIFGDMSSAKGRAMLAQPSYDIWSLGCILYQLSNEDFRPLFRGDQRDRLSAQRYHLGDSGKVLSEDSNSLWALLDWNDERKAAKLSRVKDLLARGLLGLMLHRSPHLRPGIDEILQHPYVTGDAVSVDVDAASVDVDAAASHPSQSDATSRVVVKEHFDASPARLGGISENANVRVDALSPRQGTSARVDVHRAIHLAKEGENSELRSELEQAKQRESALLEEVNKLRVALGKYVVDELVVGASATDGVVVSREA